ncbi:DUF427 domain-containing protein [Conexibacter stalactiti]|uniref:DUF427 domain-containing protein n=1 Tax=Conexibacter stalactiti TaxID=1940611 RepID=A0ABU4HM01_9ACTN|nr:DUF427 domain-containing protein [Conexibacter stalactiti]MDW5594270.1 DUF427 domain-containing protein [Conexibacter stalactiti]MEC5034912.1 DUF427 domain-containing protein [Conexibacter stalactiti]
MSTSLENKKIVSGDPAGRAFRQERVAVLPVAKRIRGLFAGRTVVDSTAALILFEHDHLPVYYFPVADVDEAVLVPSEKSTHCPYKGDASYWSIAIGDRVALEAVWGYEQGIEGAPDLRGYRAFYWNALDHWFEEDEEVFVHARDPFKRIDTLRSSRHVRIELDGVVLAETRRPTLLFETGIATRYYIPRADLRAELLRSSETITACPYKGKASYYSAQVGDRLVEDIAWTYTFPIPDIPKIEQLVAFYDEHVDVWVDGELQERPVSTWS